MLRTSFRSLCGTAAVLTAMILAATGCRSDEERISGQNSAARTAIAGGNEPGPTREIDGDSRRVSVFDLRVGDCLAEDAVYADADEDEFSESETIAIVECDGTDVAGRVSKFHLFEEDTDYPGEDQVIKLAEEVCNTPGQPFTYFFPTGESWRQGDRTITCIETTAFAYEVGACIGGEDVGYVVVPCDADGVYGDVVRVIDVTADYGPDAPLPEDTLWDTIFDEQCSADADFVLFPTAESWELGDRLVVCVLTS
jgi:hypothetical protein